MSASTLQPVDKIDSFESIKNEITKLAEGLVVHRPSNITRWLAERLVENTDIKRELESLTNRDNILLLTDSYKVTHWKQYPPGTEFVYSYFESRGGSWNNVCFFGLQYILKRYLDGVVVTKQRIEEAQSLYERHFSSDSLFYREGWEYILERHGGRLPVVIRAVPEGECVSTSNVLLTIENTDPHCFWLTNYLESLLVQVWYPCTVATSSREQKKLIMKWLRDTGSPNPSESVLFKLHDFGFRGVSSVESAGIGGLAHLVHFLGTDNVAALDYGNRYYGDSVAGFSIAASEHSTITSWGKEKELDAFRNMLEKYPDGMVACVSDSWDVFKACSELWGKELKEMILSRQKKTGGSLVIRPDSGDPAQTVTRVLDILGGEEDASSGFAEGVTRTSTGHKVLPSCIRLIQGDGVNMQSIDEILSLAASRGWAAENMSFGSGGALLQKVNRDTLKFAFKCSHVVVDGKGQDVFKDPVTDVGKRSKKGRLRLIRKERGKWETIHLEEGNVADRHGDELVEVFRDGKILVDWSFKEIRKRAEVKNDEIFL